MKIEALCENLYSIISPNVSSDYKAFKFIFGVDGLASAMYIHVLNNSSEWEEGGVGIDDSVDMGTIIEYRESHCAKLEKPWVRMEIIFNHSGHFEVQYFNDDPKIFEDDPFDNKSPNMLNSNVRNHSNLSQEKFKHTKSSNDTLNHAESELKKHLSFIEIELSKQSPKTLEKLNKKASDHLISNFQVELPSQLKLLYKWRNGIDHNEIANLFYGFGFHSLEYISSVLDGPIVDLKTNEFRIIEEGIVNPGGMINFFEIGNDSSRCFLGINLTHINDEHDGQVIIVDTQYRAVLKAANSIEHMARDFLADLKSGKYKLNEEALEDGVEFFETDSSIDYINWFKMDKYKEFA